MGKELVLKVPSEYHKNIAKNEKLVANADLIIEIVDARIMFSSSNLFSYKGKQAFNRIILIVNWELADDKVTSDWISFFETQNIFIKKYINEEKTLFEIRDKIKVLMESNDSNKSVLFVGLSTIDLENYAKEICNCPVNTDETETNIPDFSGFKNYSVDFTVKAINKNFLIKKVYLNSIILGGVETKNNISELLAFYLFKQLARKYRSKLNSHYGLHLQKTPSTDDVLKNFITILNLKGLLSPEEAPDIEKVAKIILKDIQETNIPNVSLEWVTDFQESDYE
ncbi:hypothetical protein NPX79_01230 [Spiroplasma endosymbiont of Anurida maritima]|uniref:hypothetical protein n=1 Tax=Spiroplasma endosymbiont of Anurida maritima TaxID=2967972 RepID=UPI0036D41726